MIDEREDILTRLWRRAAASDGEDRALLLEAGNMIQTLRTLIDIKDDVILEDMEPEGRA